LEKRTTGNDEIIMKIAWITLADKSYYKNYAEKLLPSWNVLPGDKFLVTDFNPIIEHFSIVDWNTINDPLSKFINQFSKSKKENNFWRKMLTQTWAVNNLQPYDILVLLDSDIEVTSFNETQFFKEINLLKENDVLWSIGLKSSEDILKYKNKVVTEPSIDSGFIIVNNTHSNKDITFNEYKDFWETGKIRNLKKAADGEVMSEMIKKYNCNFLKTKMTGPGQIVYDIGFYHYAGKKNKEDLLNGNTNGNTL
jgi:hypothetical protein